MVWLLEDPSDPFIMQECCGPGSTGRCPEPAQPEQWSNPSGGVLCPSAAIPLLAPLCLLSSERVITQAPRALAASCRTEAGDSPRPGGSPAARCVGCWRNASPESPPGGCAPAGRAAAPPPTPARRHQLELPTDPKQPSPAQGDLSRYNFCTSPVSAETLNSAECGWVKISSWTNTGASCHLNHADFSLGAAKGTQPIIFFHCKNPWWLLCLRGNSLCLKNCSLAGVEEKTRKHSY